MNIEVSGDDAAYDALMSKMVPPEPGDDNNAPADDDGDDAAVAALEASLRPEEGDEEGEDGDSEGEGAEKAPDKDNAQAPEAPADDAKVAIVINGETKEYTVADLKELAGRGEEIDVRLNEADVVGQRAATVLQDAYAAIAEDLAAYDGLDWVLEAQRMEPEEFQWHRENFTRLDARRQKVIQGVQSLDETMTARRAEAHSRAVAEAQKALTDASTGIAGWGQELYGQIMDFAASAGLPRAEAETIVNPNIIKILNDARLYREAQAATAKKVNMTPRGVRADAGAARATTDGAGKRQQALEARVKTGAVSEDDAIAVLMGRWSKRA